MSAAGESDNSDEEGEEQKAIIPCKCISRDFTLRGYCDFVYETEKPFRQNFARLDDDEFSVLYGDLKKTDWLHLQDCSMTVGVFLEYYYAHLPSERAIKKKRGCTVGIPTTIEYTFTSSTCIFGAFCSICDRLIDKAYVGATRDRQTTEEKDADKEETFDGGFTFEEALQRRYKNLGFWTEEEWLLCYNCKVKNDNSSAKLFKIVRPFEFYGDLPRGKSKYRWRSGNFNQTTPDLFRDPFVHLNQEIK